jgi:ribonuclease R
MIEEFMLAANQAVASRFTAEKWPALYRIHEAPDPEKILELLDFLPTLGVHPAPFVNSSGWFAAVLRTCQGTRHDYLINNLVLRNMQQARYSPDNIGHFGLAAPDYTHFTSPIRRYPDLMVHRQLLALNARKEGGKKPPEESPTLQQAGEFLSNREREAMLAERDMHDRLKISYMKSRVGEVFTAVISGVTEAALFIELQDLCLSGSISLDHLNDDHYFYDAKNHRLFGEIHRRVFRIGDPLEVILVNVDNVRKRLNFKPTGTTGS